MKWKAQGNLRLGIFTKCSIKLGEQLAFCYQWDVSVSRNPTECH